MRSCASSTATTTGASAASCNTNVLCYPSTAIYYTLYGQRNAANVGELINTALEAIEEANKEKLEGVFRNIDFNSEAALGRTKQRNERLQAPAGRLPRPQARHAPLAIGNLM